MPSPGRNWTRSEDGWRWGRYRIERLAPRMWVLTCRGADPSQPEIIVTTSASLRVLKHLAERRESRAARRRLLWAHGALAALSTAGLRVLNRLAEGRDPGAAGGGPLGAHAPSAARPTAGLRAGRSVPPARPVIAVVVARCFPC